MSFGGLTDGLRFLREQEQLLMISISTVLVMAGQGVISPILPLFAQEFGVGAAAIGLTLSTFALARLILNVPLGILSDRYGRRMLLVSGPIITGIGMVGSGLSQNIEQLLVWRFIAGAGSAFYMTGAMIYLADISTPENRARFIGTNQGALLLGVSIGPAVGGLLGEFYGLRVPFYAVGITALFAAIYAYLRLPETLPASPATRSSEGDGAASVPMRRAWLPMMRSRDFLAVSFVTMSIFLTRSAGRQTLVPLLSVARFNMSPGVLGGIFTAMSLSNMILVTPAAFAADRFGRKAVLIPGGTLLTVGLLMYAGANTYSMFIAASAVLALGQGIDGPAPAAYAADIAPEDARGLAMGLYRSSGDVGFVLGPPLLGYLADQSSFGWGLGVNAAMVAVATFVFAVFARETAGAQRSRVVLSEAEPAQKRAGS
ncbi:MAG TPA: MFS transporter [Dehalococcoidia bacterium]|nr:MFS transporter [Dehalococcoidia bacterium]